MVRIRSKDLSDPSFEETFDGFWFHFLTDGVFPKFCPQLVSFKTWDNMVSPFQYVANLG